MKPSGYGDFFFGEFLCHKFHWLNSCRLFRLSFLYWVNCVSLCFSRNLFILSVKFICVALFMVSLFYPPFNVCKVCSILVPFLMLVLCAFSLFLLSSSLSIVRCLSILLIFPKNWLFISLISLNFFSVFCYMNFCSLLSPSFCFLCSCFCRFLRCEHRLLIWEFSLF